MARAKRQAAKKASSKLQNVQILSDGSASSFEEDDSPTKEDEESEVESEAESEEDELVFEVEEDDRKVAPTTKVAKKPAASKQKQSSLMFMKSKSDPRVEIQHVVVATDFEVDFVEGPPPVQKFEFHNAKYTPKLQLEDPVFEKFQNAVLAQLTRIEKVGDIIELAKISGRINCPLKKCDKSFLNFEGIKYHLKNFIHFYECLGLEDSECDMSRDYWPIIIPWEFICKPRKKPVDLGFLIGFPSAVTEIDAKSTGKKEKKLSLIRNQNITVDKFHPSNLNKHFLPALLSQPTLTKNTVFYKKEGVIVTKPDYFDYDPSGYTEISMDADSDLLPDLPDLDVKVEKDKFKIKGFQSQKVDAPHTNFIINCGVFVKCMEWMDKYVVVGGENDENVDGLLQVYIVTRKTVELKILIKHRYGTVTACKWCPDSYSFGNRLGFLVASFGDGGMRVLDVPFPKDGSLTVLEVTKPLFEFLPKGYAFMSLAWENKRNWIACGTEHGIRTFNIGHFMTYDFSKTLKDSKTPPRLINFTMVHDSSILKLNFVPTNDSNTLLLSTSIDGRICFTSLIDVFNPVVLSRTAGPCFAQTYSPLMNVYVYTDNENRARMASMTNDNQNRIIARCTSTLWDFDMNEFCTYLVIASGSGLCYVNAKRALSRGVNCAIVPVYEIEIDGDEKIFKNGLPVKDIKFNSGERVDPHNMKSFRTGVYVAKFRPEYDERGMIASGGDGFFRIDMLLKSSTVKSADATPTE